jgi:hypothetical protein
MQTIRLHILSYSVLFFALGMGGTTDATKDDGDFSDGVTLAIN